MVQRELQVLKTFGYFVDQWEMKNCATDEPAYANHKTNFFSEFINDTGSKEIHGDADNKDGLANKTH